MPPLAGKRDQARSGAVALEPLGPLGSGKPLRPVLQIAGHSIGAGRGLIADRTRTQLVHPGGHLVLRPLLVLSVSGAIQGVLMQLRGVAFGKAHIHGQSRLMVGRAFGDEPALIAGVAHGDGLVHVGGHTAVAVPQRGKTVAHCGLHHGGPEGLIDHQRLAAGHGGLLDPCQPLGQGEHTGNNVLVAAQAGAELPGVGIERFPGHIGDTLPFRSLEDAAAAVGQVVGDAGNNVWQINEDALLIHPAGLSQLAAFPGSYTAAAVNGKAHLYPIAAVVGQNGKRDGFGAVRSRNGGNLRPVVLGVVDWERETGPIPAGSPSDIDLEIASSCVDKGAAGCSGGRSLCGKSGGREHPHDGDDCQQAGQGALPVGFDALGESFQHECVSSFICFEHRKRTARNRVALGLMVLN